MRKVKLLSRKDISSIFAWEVSSEVPSRGGDVDDREDTVCISVDMSHSNYGTALSWNDYSFDERSRKELRNYFESVIAEYEAMRAAFDKEVAKYFPDEVD